MGENRHAMSLPRINATFELEHHVTLAYLLRPGHVVFRVKDLLESPRPADCLKAAPEDLRITVKDYSRDIEDGIPSAHCCGSIMLLYYMIHSAGATQPHVYVAAAAWVLWIAYGRLYLGVHSPIDLVAGAALGWCLLAFWQFVEQQYIAWLVSSEHLQLQVLLASFLLLRTYPMPSRYTDTLNYAVAWLGGWAGVTVAYRHLHTAVPLQDPATAAAVFWSGVSAGSGSSSSSPLNGWLGSDYNSEQPHGSQQQILQGVGVPLTVGKILVGFGVVCISRIATKQLMLMVLRSVFAIVPHHIRCWWQPPVPDCGQHVSRSSEVDNRSDVNICKEGQQLGASVPASLGALFGTCAYVTKLQNSSNRSPVLRQAKNGTAHDVAVTARFLSYVAVGYVIFTLDVWWQPLVSKLSTHPAWLDL